MPLSDANSAMHSLMHGCLFFVVRQWVLAVDLGEVMQRVTDHTRDNDDIEGGHSGDNRVDVVCLSSPCGRMVVVVV